MSNPEPFVRVLDRLRPWIVLASAAAPLAVLMIELFPGVEGWLSEPVVAALVIYQLSFLVLLSYDTQRLVDKRPSVRVGGIQEQSSFWRTGCKMRSLDIYALNGDRMVEMVDGRNIRVQSLRLLLPSSAAIQGFYEQYPMVDDDNHAALYLEDSIKNVSVALARLQNDGHIGKFEIRRSPAFPLHFYVVANRYTTLSGFYHPDPDRPKSVGLRSRCWTTSEAVSAEAMASHFDRHWQSLEESDDAYHL